MQNKEYLAKSELGQKLTSRPERGEGYDKHGSSLTEDGGGHERLCVILQECEVEGHILAEVISNFI